MRVYLSFAFNSKIARGGSSATPLTLAKRVFLSSLVAMAAMGVGSTASAYCTLHSCQDISESQAAQDPDLEPKVCEVEDGCIVEGQELFWGSACLSFGVSATNTSELGLTADEFHDIIDDAYKVWEGVECPGGGHPSFEVGSVGIVEADGNFFCKAEPLANISVWSLATRWQRDPSALGYTSSTHNKQDGEIFDADVELNLNKIKHEHDGNYAVVLGRIAVHEAGHYLGLAHSNVGNAVMDASYNAFDLLTKELSQDDIDGICKLYPPENLTCSEPGYVEAGLNQDACDEAAAEANEEPAEVAACSVGHAGRSDRNSRGLVSVVGLGLLGLLLARKRAQ